MAVQSPPYALQQASHTASLFRQAVSASFYTTGVSGSGELAVAAQTTPNMTVQVAAGRAWMTGTQASPPAGGFTWTTQASYFGLNDASVTLTIAAANASLPRIDIVYLATNDQQFSGSLNTAVLGVVTGTAASVPAVPAAPNNALVLAQVRVNASVTSILNSNITDTRTLTGPYPAIFTCTSTTRPTNVWPGFEIFETDTNVNRVWNGTVWWPSNAVSFTSATRPTATAVGMLGYETDTTRLVTWTGVGWFSLAHVEDIGWTNATLVNSWVNFGGIFAVARYRKLTTGEVVVQGLIKSGTAGTVAFTLPVGYRPGAGLVFGTAANGGSVIHGELRILNDGTVTPQSGSGSSYFSINAKFFAEA